MKIKFILIHFVILFIMNGCSSLWNNLNGIERTLKQIYDIDTYVVPHQSNVISVNIALDRNFVDFKFIMEINLNNNRNIIIRDYNGRLNSMRLQKIGDYVIGIYYFNPRAEEDERYVIQNYFGVSLEYFNLYTGLNYTNIKDIIDNYDYIYTHVNNLPEIIFDDDKYIINYSDEIYIVNKDNENYTIDINNLLNLGISGFVRNNRDELFVVYKRLWTENDAIINNRRMSGER